MPRPAADLAALLDTAPASAVRFGQGRVVAWDSRARTNTIRWRETDLHDLPVIAPGTSMSLGVGDLVALLGWAPGQGPGTWWILGRVIPPGSSTTVTGALSFRTDDGIPIATFGEPDTDGALWRLNYGNGSPAIRAATTGTGQGARAAIALLDDRGTPVVATDPAGGLARPTLPLHLVPTAEAETDPDGPALWPSTSAGDPVPLLTGTTPIWQGRIAIGVQTETSGLATRAHWRLDFNGRTVISEQTGTGEAFATVPGWGDGRAPGETGEFTLYGWTSGPGRLWLQAVRAHTLASA
ncbi:hypothetical protein [Glycomyces sp. NPDC048151]|uniref:hypothetical protein n=1 Tax=Glycomyces sp. NPDC048151 TaxID=3364002 RepID=UPI003718AC18